MQSTFTRRAALTGTAAGAAAIVAGAAPAIAVHSPDPIFAAIEAHRAAYARFDVAVGRENQLEEELPREAQQSSVSGGTFYIAEDDDPRWIEALEATHETSKTMDQLAWGFVEHPPTTAAGAAALLAYMADVPDACLPDDFERAIIRPLAAALAKIGGAS